MHTLKEIKQKLYFDTYSVKNGVFTVRKEFFYKFGKNVGSCIEQILNVFPDAKIIEYDEVWKPFRGGASVANSSHWYVKFTFEDE